MRIGPYEVAHTETFICTEDEDVVFSTIVRLGVLGLALVGALIWRPDQVQAILAALGTTAGFLLGQRPAANQP